MFENILTILRRRSGDAGYLNIIFDINKPVPSDKQVHSIISEFMRGRAQTIGACIDLDGKVVQNNIIVLFGETDAERRESALLYEDSRYYGFNADEVVYSSLGQTTHKLKAGGLLNYV